jgi:hypothetical protein
MDPIKSVRHNMIRLLAFTVSVLVLAETSYAQERPPIFQQMFKTYGIFLAAGNGNQRRT